MDTINIAIIGAGASGCAAAYRLGERFPEEEIYLLEKNSVIGGEQSGHNSGVNHSRYQHHPSSLKSRLRGRSPISLQNFCSQYGIKHKTVGKLIVAINEDETIQLLRYKQNADTAGKETGIPIETELLSKQQIQLLEPNIQCFSALHTPKTGIVDAAAYVRKLADLAEQQGTTILKNAQVIRLQPDGNSFILQVKQGDQHTGYQEYEFCAKMVINAAGLYADQIAKMANPDFPYTIKGLRGEYMKFNTNSRPELSMNGKCVYPVPTVIEGMFDEHGLPKRAGGNHLTPIFNAEGNISNWVWVGPLHKVVNEKDDYSHNRRTPEEFILNLPFFKQLRAEDLQEEQTGIQVKIPNYEDWVIRRDQKYPNLVHYIEDSPGMSGSLDSSYYVVHDVLGEELYLRY
ncbi:MAG: FAD-dependent oxidoreductase [Nanoarchaeota archaeon]|nr:FAD-dependent oxidoreductase [Nanoarchaeota archaeon]